MPKANAEYARAAMNFIVTASGREQAYDRPRAVLAGAGQRSYKRMKPPFFKQQPKTQQTVTQNPSTPATKQTPHAKADQ